MYAAIMKKQVAAFYYLPVLIFFPTARQVNPIQANIPSLEEVSGIWINADTISMTPSVRNFRGQAQLNRDMSSLSWFASAPYSGGYHTGVIACKREIAAGAIISLVSLAGIATGFHA